MCGVANWRFAFYSGLARCGSRFHELESVFCFAFNCERRFVHSLCAGSEEATVLMTGAEFTNRDRSKISNG
jgi:hypothetical protein